jgi:hypothetical protein
MIANFALTPELKLNCSSYRSNLGCRVAQRKRLSPGRGENASTTSDAYPPTLALVPPPLLSRHQLASPNSHDRQHRRSRALTGSDSAQRWARQRGTGADLGHCRRTRRSRPTLSHRAPPPAPHAACRKTPPPMTRKPSATAVSCSSRPPSKGIPLTCHIPEPERISPLTASWRRPPLAYRSGGGHPSRSSNVGSRLSSQSRRTVRG